MTVKQAYLAELAAKGYQSDPAQLRAVDALQRCADEWAQYKARRSNAIKKLINRPEIPRGVYMYGGVGRGSPEIAHPLGDPRLFIVARHQHNNLHVSPACVVLLKRRMRPCGHPSGLASLDTAYTGAT